MKWYHALLKRTLSGIILFLIPLAVLLIVLGKAIGIVQKLIEPLKKHLPADRVLGVGIITIISIFLILLLCFLAGVLSERKRIKSIITKIEDNVLIFIPGYSLLKAQGNNVIQETDHKWQSVLLEEDDTWKIGVAVEQQDGYCTVFFPEPPDAKTGETKVIHESKLKKLDMPVNKLMMIIRKYGQGAAAILKDAQ